jgi:hypothetical protein
MRDPTTYRRYAQECRRLAKEMSGGNRHVLLEIAQAWSDLASDLAQEHQNPRSGGHDELTKGRAD